MSDVLQTDIYLRNGKLTVGYLTNIDQFERFRSATKYEFFEEKEINTFFPCNAIIAIESSKLIAPQKHRIDDWHSDDDEYGEGNSFILYPRVDSTIEGGYLRISDFSFSDERLKEIVEQTNRTMNYPIVSWCKDKNDNNNNGEFQNEDTSLDNCLIFNNRTSINFYPFIMFSGNVPHKVEPINGTGIRECVLVYYR